MWSLFLTNCLIRLHQTDPDKLDLEWTLSDNLDFEVLCVGCSLLLSFFCELGAYSSVARVFLLCDWVFLSIRCCFRPSQNSKLVCENDRIWFPRKFFIEMMQFFSSSKWCVLSPTHPGVMIQYTHFTIGRFKLALFYFHGFTFHHFVPLHLCRCEVRKDKVWRKNVMRKKPIILTL